jgi:hypothetical protein
MRTALARRTAPLLLVTALIAPATTSAGATTAARLAAGSPSSQPNGTYSPLNATRIFDTRTGNPIASGGTVRLQIQGVAGLPAAGISAVTVILSVLTPAAAGSLSVFPSGTSWPGAATISFAAASTQQNTVTAQLGSDGALSVRNNAPAAVQLVADVVGYYTTGPAVPGGYQPVPLQRILDTRAAGSQPLASGAMVNVSVTGHGAIPASNVSAGAINLTVLSPAGTGSISVFPSGTAWDTSTTASFTAGQTEQSMLTAQLGNDGAFTVRNDAGTAVQLVIDILGYYIAGSPPAAGGFVPMARDRIFDTREYLPFQGGELRTVPTLGTSMYFLGTKTPDWGLRAETILLTVVSPSQSGSVSVYAGHHNFDGKATVSFTAGHTAQRLVTVRIPQDGEIQVRNNSSVTLSVVTDVEGYFAGVQNRLQVTASALLDPNVDANGVADVSCTSASFCLAVTSGGMAYRYDGTGWSAGFRSPGASAVSCVSPSFCMTAGDGVSIYDGTQWLPPPAGAPAYGNSVSCASATFCVVTNTTAYVFNGTGWDGGTLLNPQAQATWVSCPAPTFCAALAGGRFQWDGSHWSGAALGSSLESDRVSCASPAFCQEATYVESSVWDGTDWKLVRTPDNHFASSVSCPAAFACLVGDEAEISGWDGSEWSMPIAGINRPLRVFRLSCPTVHFCMAISDKTAYRLEG